MNATRKFINERAASLIANAKTATLQAELILQRKWRDVDWEYLERKMPIEDVEELYEMA
jgi:hypothetical protein